MVNIVGLNFDDVTEDVVVVKSERLFDVGVYECKIESVTIEEQKSTHDKNWLPIKVVISADGYRNKSLFMFLPLNSEGFMQYNGSEKTARFMRRKLGELMMALLNKPEYTSAQDFAKDIGLLFTKPEKMAGLRVVVEFAHKFKHSYAKYTGTRNSYHLVSPEGAVHCDDEGTPIIFGDHKECEKVAKELGWDYDPFVDAQTFKPSAQPNDLKRFGGTKTAPIAGIDEE